MQLRAHDKDGAIIYAYEASRRHDYFCLECNGIVRLRGGNHRQNHFYHLIHARQCRQNGKSMEHLEAQHYIKSLIDDDCQLEHVFPSIGRIADCVWFSKKIIFEIQCSPISVNEVRQRNADYKKEGYQVIWLLHDKRYNQRRMTAAEKWLQRHPHFFIRIDLNDRCRIYDQYDVIVKGFRQTLLSASTVDVSTSTSIEYDQLPKKLKERATAWKYSFEGDWIARSRLSTDISEINTALSPLSEPKPNFKKRISSTWNHLIKEPIRAIFNGFLEIACR